MVALKTKAHATLADVEAGRTTFFQKRGNDAADLFAKRGAGAHPSAAEAYQVTKACSLVAQEAVQWAVRQEQWLSEHGLVDSQSIVDPPLQTQSGNTGSISSTAHLMEIGEASAGNGAFQGHRIVFMRSCNPRQGDALGCLHCGAYATAKARRLRRECQGARTAKQRRQRDAILSERYPIHPYSRLLDSRPSAVLELAWLAKTRKRKQAAAPEDHRVSWSRAETLCRYGLVDSAALQSWQAKVRGAASAGIGALQGDVLQEPAPPPCSTAGTVAPAAAETDEAAPAAVTVSARAWLNTAEHVEPEETVLELAPAGVAGSTPAWPSSKEHTEPEEEVEDGKEEEPADVTDSAPACPYFVETAEAAVPVAAELAEGSLVPPSIPGAEDDGDGQASGHWPVGVLSDLLELEAEGMSVSWPHDCGPARARALVQAARRVWPSR